MFIRVGFVVASLKVIINQRACQVFFSLLNILKHREEKKKLPTEIELAYYECLTKEV
jgi:hypothetical protein